MNAMPARASHRQYLRLARIRHIAGIGASYRINDRYSISATGGRMTWGRNVHDLKYAYDVALSRSF